MDQRQQKPYLHRQKLGAIDDRNCFTLILLVTSDVPHHTIKSHLIKRNIYLHIVFTDKLAVRCDVM